MKEGKILVFFGGGGRARTSGVQFMKRVIEVYGEKES